MSSTLIFIYTGLALVGAFLAPGSGWAFGLTLGVLFTKGWVMAIVVGLATSWYISKVGAMESQTHFGLLLIFGIVGVIWNTVASFKKDPAAKEE